MDHTLMYLAYQVADYMYYEPDHVSKFAEDCKTEEDIQHINELIAKLLSMLDGKHLEREAILIDHIVTMISSAYLYTELVDTYRATLLCIELSEVIRRYTACVYSADEYRRRVAKEQLTTVTSAKFGLMKAFQGEMKTEIKPVAYTLSVRISLRKVYDEIEKYAESLANR